jgi:predicted DNA-binding protein (MmcQ/YjbR family)
MVKEVEDKRPAVSLKASPELAELLRDSMWISAPADI